MLGSNRRPARPEQGSTRSIDKKQCRHQDSAGVQQAFPDYQSEILFMTNNAVVPSDIAEGYYPEVLLS